jgi:hypothetical protein
MVTPEPKVVAPFDKLERPCAVADFGPRCPSKGYLGFHPDEAAAIAFRPGGAKEE